MYESPWQVKLDEWCDSITDKQLICGTAVLYAIVSIVTLIVDWI